MAIFIENTDISGAKFFSDLVYKFSGFGMKSQVIESAVATVISGIPEALFGLDKDQVGIIFLIADALVPRLKLRVAQFIQKPAPEVLCGDEVFHINLHVMQQPGFRHAIFSF